MKIALFYAVCEGEFEIASDSLDRLLKLCPQHQFDIFVVDDASPSRVGERLISERADRFGHCELIRLPKSLGFWGCCTRMLIAFRQILASNRVYDFVLKMDADLFPVRSDLGAELERACTDRNALYGCLFDLRRRDAVLVLADLFPVGFARQSVDGVMSRPWKLRRLGRTWWDDLGFSAIKNGYRFRSAGGSFWLLGFNALCSMGRSDLLKRDDSRFGLHVSDDSLLTIVCHGLGIKVVDLGENSPSWRGVLGFGADAPWDLVETSRPFVVHPLKNSKPGWQRRKDLAQRLSNPDPIGS
jgi:glycosyltransferase involved in cell wall biosynthesis